jgi:hypothetical protein
LAITKSLELKSLSSNSVDTFYSLLKDEGYLYRLSDYQVPFHWDFIQFFVLFLIGDFLFQDIENNRTYLLVRCRSKLNYVLSKMGWIVFQNLFIYITLFVVIYVISSFILKNFTIGDSGYFHKHIESLMEIKTTSQNLVVRILAGYILTSILLSSMLLLSIQFLSPIMTFFGVIIICVISTFSDSKWLPAIHSMILKQSIFNLEHQLTLSFSMIYCGILYLITTLVTLYVFQKKDIL